MDTNTLPISRFKAQLSKFSGIISKPYCKTTRRFFREMLYGIQASKDIKLSNIGRSLQEDISLIKTEDRLRPCWSCEADREFFVLLFF